MSESEARLAALEAAYGARPLVDFVDDYRKSNAVIERNLASPISGLCTARLEMLVEHQERLNRTLERRNKRRQALHAPETGNPLVLKHVQQMAQDIADVACAPILEQETDYHQALSEIEKIITRLRFETRREEVQHGASKIRDLLQVVEAYADK